MADVSREASVIEAEEQSTDALHRTPVPARTWLAVVAFVLLAPALVRFGAFESRPAFDTAIRDSIERTAPDIVFLGNSMLDSRIDPATLDERLGAGRALVMAQAGVTSAYWHQVIKNQIGPAEPRPRLLIVFFRDAHLTEPTFRIDGKYRKTIQSVSHADEPLFDEIIASRLTWQERLERWLLDVFPLQGARDDIVVAMQRLVSWPLDVEARSTPGSRYNPLFALDRLRPARGDDLGRDRRRGGMDFATNVERSFLPSMIDLLREAGIGLHFVRVQRRPRADGPPPVSEELARYLGDLQTYLAERGVAYHDFHGDPEITLDRYRDGDHIADPVWYTDLFVKRLGKALD